LTSLKIQLTLELTSSKFECVYSGMNKISVVCVHIVNNNANVSISK